MDAGLLRAMLRSNLFLIVMGNTPGISAPYDAGELLERNLRVVPPWMLQAWNLFLVGIFCVVFGICHTSRWATANHRTGGSCGQRFLVVQSAHQICTRARVG